MKNNYNCYKYIMKVQVYMSTNTSWKAIMDGDHVLLLNSSQLQND